MLTKIDGSSFLPIMPVMFLLLNPWPIISFIRAFLRLVFIWQNDFHLHCREWDELLSSGDWEPEKIAEKIPEFLRFVKKVQGVVVHEMKDPGLTKTSKQKPLIIYFNPVNN